MTVFSCIEYTYTKVLAFFFDKYDHGLYLLVFARICMYLVITRLFDSELVNITPWHCTAVESRTSTAPHDNVFSSTKMFYCILSCHPFCSQLAKSWPRSWCRTGGFQCQGIPDECTCQVDSTLPCGRAFAWEWCRHLLLELAAILSDTVKYEHILTSYYASHEIWKYIYKQ